MRAVIIGLPVIIYLGGSGGPSDPVTHLQAVSAVAIAGIIYVVTLAMDWLDKKLWSKRDAT